MTNEYVEMLAEDVPLDVFIVRDEDGMIMRVDDKYAEDDDEGDPWAVFVYEPSANVDEWVHETRCYGENVKVLIFDKNYISLIPAENVTSMTGGVQGLRSHGVSR